MQLTRRRVLLLSSSLWLVSGVRASATSPWQALPTLRLGSDGRAELLSRRVEMGQGAHAGLHALVCDELGLAPARLQVRNAPVERHLGAMLTGGSYTAAGAERAMRPLVAGVRMRLEQAAASMWAVPLVECSARDGAVVHEPSGRRIPFEALLSQAAVLPEPDRQAIVLRGSRPGQPRPAAPHARSVVDGSARYGLDQRAPGQLYAVLARAPSLNARLAHVDAAACREVAGFVEAVPLAGNRFPALNHVRNSVAVVARDSWSALQARERLSLRWDEEPDALALDDAEIARVLEAHAPWPAAGGWRWEAQLPAYPHLPMEPPNALAEPRPDGGLRLATGTQRQTRLLDALELEHGWAPGAVQIEVPLLGGGFGRRLEVDYAVEAALLARQLGRPVQVLWSREDDLRHGLFRPPSLHRIVARLRDGGRIAQWAHTCASVSVFGQQEPAELAADAGDWTLRMPMLAFPYDVPQVDHEPRVAPLPLPAAWWRGTAWTQVTVAVEMALNELARQHGHDAVALRLRHLGATDPRRVRHGPRIDLLIEPARLRHVLSRAAAMAGWPRARCAPACGFYDCDGTYVAAIAEASADGSRIDRLWLSVDCGRRLDDDIVRQQVEGSVAFALSALRSGGMRWSRGRVLQQSLAELMPLPLAEWPELAIDLVDSDAPVSGIGEPVVPPVMAAAASALAFVKNAS
jgi:isoquinoline 1-oxidoreductase beta subunit